MDSESAALLNEEPNQVKPCSSMQKFCYGLGHIFNDLCAAIWFSYALFYFQIVLQMEPGIAGTLMMVGQVADSLATPAAGYVVDRISTRKRWHFVGTLAVFLGFTLMFSLKFDQINWSFLLLYNVLIIIFQIGWAIVQISHLSIIPVIATDHTQSVDLTAIRYTASVCCNIFVYIITWIILKKNGISNPVGPGDFDKFKEINIIISTSGIICSLIFYCGIKYREPQEKTAEVSTENGEVNKLQIIENGHVSTKHFLKSSVIYQVSLMYMASRLFTTLNLIYIPLYLDEKSAILVENGTSLRVAIATVPLVCFISSFLTSIVLKTSAKNFNDKIVYFSGTLFCLIGSILVSLNINQIISIQIYIVVIFIGIGGSATMVSSLCITAEFVKCNGFKGASVYSTVTFTDKLISGAIVLIIQYLQCEPKEECPDFYRQVLAYACGCTAFIGLISLISLHYYLKFKYNRILYQNGMNK